MRRALLLPFFALLAPPASGRPSDDSLAASPSPYLQEGARSPVKWRSYGKAALDQARREKKPILVDVGAGWCHWCHVMDETTYTDPDVARTLNERYIPIKIDRDLSPDLDAHFQKVARELGRAGGWPLTVWLSSDGEPTFAATYLPAPTMRELLATRAGGAAPARREPEPDDDRPGAVRAEVSDAIGAGLTQRCDPEFGGLGIRGPKFPSGPSVQLLLALADRRGQAGDAFECARRTLDGMARGGFRDHVGGGFHRYAVDGAWAVPHFEKMSYVQSQLVAAYLDGYRAIGSDGYRDVARETIGYLLSDAGSDAVRGGFYASQDADAAPGDDGAYYTWTLAELRAVAGEAAVARFGARAVPNDVAGTPDRNVLRVSPKAPPLPAGEARRLVEKLRAARGRRRAPRVDTTKYAAWNGMAIVALLDAHAVLGLPRARDQALRALDFFLDHSPGVHALTDGGAVASPPGERRLDDLGQLTLAALAAYQATGRPRYLAAARALVADADRALWRPALARYGASTDPLAPPPSAVDDATPSPSAEMARALSRLAAITGERRYAERADLELAAHAGGLGVNSAAYGLAILEHTTPRVTVAVVAPRAGDANAARLADAARAAYRPGRVLRWYDASAPSKPPYPLGRDGAARLYVCSATSCAPPVADPEQARALVERWGR